MEKVDHFTKTILQIKDSNINLFIKIILDNIYLAIEFRFSMVH